MSNPNPRKRAAPGAAPIVTMQQQMENPLAPGNGTADQMVKWNGGGGMDNFANFMDNNAQPGGNSYDLMQNAPQYPQSFATPSNSLARRPMNGALIPANTRSNFDSPGSWGFDDDALIPKSEDEPVEQDNVEQLEEMAQRAKRDSQGKRKQIPPFVQKLSSFLEEGKNEDLIRWSSKGDSFVVLDEDEFARTLIPELFKHNNYASFVRQLNMYGFHKRVGLSDNSMRASERKNKSPSEYYNPYFRRGHPNLLWLINKPKSGGKGKKTKNAEAEGESDDEIGQDDMPGQVPAISNIPPSRPYALPPTEQPAPKKEMTLIRDELGKVRNQQKLILQTINRLQQNNNDLYNQALLFQSQHDRHQNSINAILNFLANLFRKSLEEQGGSQSVSDILSSMLANQGQQATQAGNIVDLGDFFQSQVNAGTLGGPPHKRARGLLPPIPDQNPPAQPSRASSAGRSSWNSGHAHNPEMGQVTELVDGSPPETSPNLRQELESNPQERMMKIINDHNATNTSGMDLPEAAELVANAPNTLNQDQRSQLVNFMARQSSTPSSIPTPPQPRHKTPPVSMRPEHSPSQVDSNAGAPSLSPIMRSPAMPPLSLHHVDANQSELNQLQRMQNDQDAKITELTEMLGPLSPSGRIPEVDPTDPYFDPGNVDLSQFIDSNAFFDGEQFGGTGDDFNFGSDNHMFGAGGGGGENGNVGNTPSPTGTEEIQREDVQNGQDDRNRKRRRVQ